MTDRQGGARATRGRAARFKVDGRLDGASGGTVTIDRKTGLFSVRPLFRRREYVLPLSTVAELVIARIVKAELANDLASKRRAWPSRRRA